MRNVSACCLVLTLSILSPSAYAASIGYQAELSELFHDVSGTVTILDADTLQVDNFTFDGQGFSVYFYLGESDTDSAYSAGLEIGPQLVGDAFDGTQAPILIDLPVGQTFDDWNAISVWCVPFTANFGSGTFYNRADFNNDGLVDLSDLNILGSNFGHIGDAVKMQGDANDDGNVDLADLNLLGSNWGDGTMPAAVPEPSSMAMLMLASGAVGALRYRFNRGA